MTERENAGKTAKIVAKDGEQLKKPIEEAIR